MEARRPGAVNLFFNVEDEVAVGRLSQSEPTQG